MIAKLFLLVLIIGGLAWARKATPAHNKRGQGLLDNHSGGHAQLSDEPNTIRVATYNIQTGKSDEGKRNLSASAGVLKGVDLAGVQEVYAPSLMNIFGFGLQQTEVLAQQGCFSWLFCATRRRWLREHRGNAILSKLKVHDWRVEMLPDQSGKSYRNMTIAEVEWQGQRFHFINTHLHTRHGRAEQLNVVLQEFAKYPRAILVGDFNSKRNMPELDSALRDIDITDAILTAGLDLGNSSRIDWILTKGFAVESGHTLDKGVSDHPYYEVTLSYNS